MDEATNSAPPTALQRPWKIIVADDDEEMHGATRFALRNFRFDGNGLELLSAYSAAEACALAKANPDAAVLLLDVVMETEQAGLEIIPKIRAEPGGAKIRIVLRTGQPGKAPQAEVLERYDIDDYHEKTELTGLRLNTVLRSCLRAYRDIAALEANKRGLEKVMDASAAIFRLQTVDRFTSGALEQLNELLPLAQDLLYADAPMARSALAASSDDDGEFRVVAATGSFADAIGKTVAQILPADSVAHIDANLTAGVAGCRDGRYVGAYHGPGPSKLLYVEGCGEAGEVARGLIDVFSRNIGLGFDNLQLKESIEDTHREIAYRLGGAVESRSKETANHIRRVAQMSALIGQAYGLSDREVEVLRHAAPLHDVGKVGISDHILNKPGPHTPQEWTIMKTHAQIGADLLGGSDHEILRIGALIALEHHERWDGGGYPCRKAGREISIQGRIVAAIDVFDALGSRRCYKEAWPIEKILAVLQDQSGRHFDPDVVRLMLERVEELEMIRRLHPDS